MTPERLAEIERFLAAAFTGAPSSLIALEMARDLLTALREAQQDCDEMGQATADVTRRALRAEVERDALQQRVEALEKVAQKARQALLEYIRVVLSVSRPYSFTTEIADAGGIARATIKALDAALHGEETG